MRKCLLQIAISVCVCVLAGICVERNGFAQTSYLFMGATPRLEERPVLTLAQTSYIATQLPARREFREHDLVTVRVKKQFRSLNEGEMERKRRMESEYGITKWVNFDGLSFGASTLSNGAPAVAGEINSRFKNEGTYTRRDNVEFTIQCKVESILENGVLYLTGTDTVGIGEESKKIEISGYARPEDVSTDNVILSDRIHDCDIREVPSGNVNDSIKRNWGQKAIDRWSPF